MQHIRRDGMPAHHLCLGCQNRDGTAHYAYYDVHRGLSLVWDGEAPFVEVCEDGYGGPVVDLVPVDARHRDLGAFGCLCRLSLRRSWSGCGRW